MEYKIRTDLAIETREIYKTAQKIDDEIPGVETSIDDSDEDMLITKVKVISPEPLREKVASAAKAIYSAYEQ